MQDSSAAAAPAMAGESMSASSIAAEAVTGSHVLKIVGYSRTKALGNGGSIKSSVFDLGGHRWYITYYPDGSKVQKAEEGWGYPWFIKKASLEESTYLKDDSFRVQCDVTVSKEFRVEDTTQFVTVPPSDMHRHFADLLQDGEGADVTFQAELFGPMKEKAMSSIRIDDMEARVFKAMLHFIYTDTMPDIDKEDAFHIDTSTVATTLALAEQHSCHGLKKACLNFLDLPSHLKAAMENEGFDHLMSSCPSVVKELMAKLCSLSLPSSLPRASLVRKRWFRLV
ncbi:hypothetical protein HU200_011366 [Digitaria exilis]|uniref:MATH domain-containing protein n=1 Tax=Digitaria exilis TaxID=1010633 RepID=A0A835KP55_9POAL|nr:hypothetical protein HU200_011366 [Digitaria exilis]